MKYAWQGKPLQLHEVICDSCAWNWVNYDECLNVFAI